MVLIILYHIQICKFCNLFWRYLHAQLRRNRISSSDRGIILFNHDAESAFDSTRGFLQAAQQLYQNTMFPGSFT